MMGHNRKKITNSLLFVLSLLSVHVLLACAEAEEVEQNLDLTAATAVAAPAPTKCSCKMPSGSTYDLTKFGTTKQSTPGDSGMIYEYTPCAATTCANIGQSAVCMRYTSFNFGFSLGQPVLDCTAWTEPTPGKGFTLTFTGGTQSGSGSMSSTIEFVCGTTDKGWKFVSDSNSLQYNFRWESPNACALPKPGGGGGSGGLSGGWIFIIVLLVVTVLYLIGGVAWNKFKMDKTGLDLIPNKDFWFDLPALVKDGNIFLYKKALGLCGKNYETV